MPEKCHQQLCKRAAKLDMHCARCGEYFCSSEHATWHVMDAHLDHGLIKRGKATPPVIEMPAALLK